MAQHYFYQCGWKELDGNNDGIPCNKLYRQAQQNRN
nr:excalibur calcium-binding domain-containing protein [Mannheimia granulomatis]